MGQKGFGSIVFIFFILIISIGMIGGSLAIKKYDPSIIPYLSNPSETLVQKDSRNENINSTTYVIPKPVSNSAMVKGKDPTNIDVKAIEQMNISDNSRIFTIKSGGFDRTYNIHIPITYDRSKLISLLFAFHGAGDDGLGMEKYSGLSELADNSNVLVVYPNGYKMYWSDGRGMAPGDSEGINDVQFVTNMIADISSKYHIDSTKIYATGFSSGGFFVHKLACELSDKIFGFVAVSAALADNIAKNCSNKVSHPFMMIMGTNDVAYNGAVTKTGIPIYSAQDSLQKWAIYNKCSSQSLTAKVGVVTTTIYSECDNNSQVELIVGNGMPHSWPTKNINAADEIFKFLKL